MRNDSESGNAVKTYPIYGWSPCNDCHALARSPFHGRRKPQDLLKGFLSGVGHPIIGIDHLAFIGLVGLGSALLGAKKLPAATFVAATLIGYPIITGVSVPFVEITIALSILFVAGFIIFGGILNNLAQTIIFGTAGLFHGWAYGNAIIGAETAPLLSYLFGLGLTLCIIALLVLWTALKIWQVQSGQTFQPRIAAGVCLGVGITFFIEQIEGLAFRL